MHGNVFEWYSDWYGTYSTTAQTNPTGPSTGAYRVHRGGAWGFNVGLCRSATRGNSIPDGTDNDVGFRLAFAP